MRRRFDRLLLVGFGFVIGLGSSCGKPQSAGHADRITPQATNRTALATAAPGVAVPPEPRAFTWPAEAGSTMAVAEAVMVTAELDFGPRTPSIAAALGEVDRLYQPDDGQGRTFAILDAYGEPTADGKLHISMHVSSEKAGRGAMVFRRTGQVLWHAQIRPATQPVPVPFTRQNLDIMIADEHGNDHLLDGAGVSQSILDAAVHDQGVPVREYWPDGAERQLTFFYSACGCPVKVMCRRLGERTRRMNDLPVIFPDDPDVVVTISRLLGWSAS